MPYRETQTETPLKPYIQMFFRSPKEFINTKYTAKELYDRSKVFTLENGLDPIYSIQEFGKGITKLIGQYKKRTKSGITYDLHMNINEFNKLLTDYESSITEVEKKKISEKNENFKTSQVKVKLLDKLLSEHEIFKTNKSQDKLLGEYINSVTDIEKKKIFTKIKSIDRARRYSLEKKQEKQELMHLNSKFIFQIT